MDKTPLLDTVQPGEALDGLGFVNLEDEAPVSPVPACASSQTPPLARAAARTCLGSVLQKAARPAWRAAACALYGPRISRDQQRSNGGLDVRRLRPSYPTRRSSPRPGRLLPKTCSQFVPATPPASGSESARAFVPALAHRDIRPNRLEGATRTLVEVLLHIRHTAFGEYDLP